MRTISINDKDFIIKIPYDIAMVNLIKTSFSPRFWANDIKAWKAPINEKNVLAVLKLNKDHAFDISTIGTKFEEYRTTFEEQRKVADIKIQQSKSIDADIEIPSLKMELYPYQKAGVQFIENTKGKTLLADEMGLGKTVQAIAWTLLHPEKIPILVICPATLKINWQREFQKWSYIKSYVINSQDTNLTFLKGVNTYIINYDIVEKLQGRLQKMDFQVIILDESHYIKNAKSKRSKAINVLVGDTSHIIAISGTPFLNRPIELYNVLKMLSPLNFGNYFEYASRYCGMTRTRWGMDVSGATNIAELGNKLRSTVMVRREKKDVLAELPGKTRIVIPQVCDLKMYKKVEDNLINYLIENKNKTKTQAEKSGKVEQFAMIEYCKQEAVKAKLPLFTEWVKDFIEENGKLVIFVHHKEFIDILMNELKEFKAVKIVGGMELNNRQKSIDEFQNNKDTKVIICSLKAANVGITLTATSYVAFLELGWTPGDHDQAEDRCHRIGQKDNVSCYYFIAENTIETKIYELIQKKRKIFIELMQDKHIVNEEKTNILGDLINSLIIKGGG